MPQALPSVPPGAAGADPSTPDPGACPVERTLRLLSGKWRLLILFRLGRGPVRWGALRRDLAPVTPRVLTAALRALEDDGLIWRRTEQVVPPAVSYGLSSRGEALAPIFEAMGAWGAAQGDRGPAQGAEAATTGDGVSAAHGAGVVVEGEGSDR